MDKLVGPMGLQQFERRLESLVEGLFVKAFRSGLQPIELAKRLTREMDANRTVSVRGIVVPNHFTIALSPSDREKFAAAASVLARELGDAVREHAREEGYAFLGPVVVELETQDSLGAGEFLVASEMREAPGGGPGGSLVLTDATRIVIGEHPIVIGRLPECDVVLTDPNVSRRHAEVRRQGSEIVVADLGSTNGTKVNNTGIQERALAHGDTIRVGSTELLFEAS